MEKDLINKIKEYDTIIVQRHTRPDGDALGSQLGLSESIKKTFPKKKVYVVGDSNPRISFLGKMDEIDDNVYKDALVIICDVAVSYMVSDERYKLAKEVFIIDHHTNKSDITENVLIDSTRSACAEYIADILFRNNFVVDKDVAKYLYTGLITDSGRFQYVSSDSRPFFIAGKLIETGINPQSIYNNLYVETLEKRKLTASFTNRFKTTKNNVAYMINEKEDLEKYNISFNDCSRGMVSVMAGIVGINIWANFTYDETKDKYIAEFRSRGLSIVDIAKKYGGGGHDQACGATLDNIDDCKKVLADFDLLMEEYNEKNI